jgi:hypothetical protein
MLYFVILLFRDSCAISIMSSLNIFMFCLAWELDLKNVAFIVESFALFLQRICARYKIEPKWPDLHFTRSHDLTYLLSSNHVDRRGSMAPSLIRKLLLTSTAAVRSMYCICVQ